MSNQIISKTPKEISIMKEGGKKLAEVKKKLGEAVKEGENAYKIEELANELIKKAGGKASFKMVPNYDWATCVNVNEGVVHGIPKKETVFKDGDVVSIDVGIYYKGFHTDTSLTVAINPDKETKKFLGVGMEALTKAISKCVPGNHIYDISKAIEDTLEKNELSPIKALVGHGIGRALHEEPHIQCFTKEKRQKTPVIPEGATMAIEVMYTRGSSDLILENDGWTISTRNGKIASLFEETVAVIGGGSVVLTKN